MPKRKRSDRTPEVIGLVFDQIFAATSNTDSNLPGGTAASSHKQKFTQYLKQLKAQVLSEAAEGERETKMAAKEFTLEDAVEAFRLTYSTVMSESKKHFWNIEDLPETKDFAQTPCISKTSQ
jgi:hypothetical protein